MSNREIQDFTNKLEYGLQLAEKRMLREKAMRDECVVVCGDDGSIQHISARQVIANNVMFQ
jgi:hypothetical protein